MVQTIFVAILAGTGRGALPIICLQQGQLQISLVAVRKKASCWKYSVELPSRMALPLLPIEWKSRLTSVNLFFNGRFDC